MEKRKKGRRRKGKIEEGILYAEKFEFFRVEKEKEKKKKIRSHLTKGRIDFDSLNFNSVDVKPPR